ncbi:MAG TPA: hypothetical protein VF757_04785 [Sphingomicrobium sp.]
MRASDSSSVVESRTVEQQRQEEPPPEVTNQEEGGPEAAATHEERAPYAVRLRVILALSLACWAILALAIIWLVRHF